MTTYQIEPTRETLHGAFSRDYLPILTIDSGDTVLFRTLNSAWALEPPSFTKAQIRQFEPRIKGRDDGHALCGPLAIRDAQPGMTLEIRINEVRPGAWGWTGGGGWENAVNQRLGLVEQGVELIWALDADAMIGRDQYGHTIVLRPFMAQSYAGCHEAQHTKPEKHHSSLKAYFVLFVTSLSPREVSIFEKNSSGEDEEHVLNAFLTSLEMLFRVCLLLRCAS